MKTTGQDGSDTGLQTEYVAVPDKEIPKVLEQEKPQEQPQQKQEPQPQIGWTPEAVEVLIKSMAIMLQKRSKAASDVLTEQSKYLSEATAPVLNKYVKTEFGVEVNCALAWGMVGVTIYQRHIEEKEKHNEYMKKLGASA